MHVTKNVRFISATIDIKLIEIAYKAMIRSGLRRILRIQIDPLVLNCLKLSQVVKIDPSFPRITTEKENTILEGKAVCARSRCRLIVCPLRI